MAQAQFPEPKDLEVDFVNRTGDSQPKVFNQWSVSNPHPGYGKDPNILNEYGHSVYPKMVYPQGQSQPGVIVNDQDEENRLLNMPEKPAEAPKINGGWGTPK